MRFKGKVALITAAASGIGRATANIIGREGGRIAAVDNNRERLDATIAEIAAAASSSAYSAAKGGIIALTTKLANELGPFGINVNAIAPATTLTERIRPRWEQRPPEERAADIQRTPLRRMGEAARLPEEVAYW